MLVRVDMWSTANPSALRGFLEAFEAMNIEERWLMGAAVAAFVAAIALLIAGTRRARRVAAASVSAPPSADTAPVSVSPPVSGPVTRSDIREIAPLPRINYDEDAEDEGTLVGAAATITNPAPTKIVYDTDAEPEEPTQNQALILVTATGHTDRGLHRKRNEDSYLVLEDQALFVIADGMGGYAGGAVASQLAVETIGDAFRKHEFQGHEHNQIPKRASELARAVQMANETIFKQSRQDPRLAGMGTTVCAARFSPNKQRLYIAHVGDSRLYRLRRGTLRQMTADHTMRDLGVAGDGSTHLSRAVGVWPKVQIDVVLGKPMPDDVYCLCSDGLSKMVSDEELANVLGSEPPKVAVARLIDAANANGGLDNVTVIIVRIESARRSRAA